MNLNRLHTTLRKEFAELPAPTDFGPLIGAHRGVYVGPKPIRASGPAFMRVLRFRGWFGKRFEPGAADGNGDGVAPTGINRFDGGDQSHDRVPMIISIGPSLVDGRPAFVTEYPPETITPWNRARDEFRAIDDHRLLGITIFKYPGGKLLPLAFVLERDPA